MTTPIVTRRADLNDLDALLACVAAGFDSYRAFAPPGWEPPDREAGRDLASELLADPDTWALIALIDDAFAGHASFVPGRERSGARLFTPSGHARARRFYERRGWIAGDEGWDEHLRLALVEYRLELGDEARTGSPA